MAIPETTTKVADYKPYNFVDGEGVRCSLYVRGCHFACYTEELKERILSDLGASYCQGLTLLGGEPFLHTAVLIDLCQEVRRRYGHSKDIWSWTGYDWEELMQETPDKLELLSYVDILVDGRFIQEQLDLTLQFRGSRNQRIIDVPKSLATGQVVIWDKLIR